MVEANPYQVPRSVVADADDGEYGEVKLFSARGRMGRLRYLGYSSGYYLLAVVIGGMLAGAFAGAQEGGGAKELGGVLPAIVVFAVMPLMLMLTIQRLHDLNLNGWFSLLLLVPFINLLASIALMVVPGTRGSNRFGLRPPPNSTGVVVIGLIMPALFVLGIIAAIAIPAYQSYVQEARMQMGQQ